MARNFTTGDSNDRKLQIGTTTELKKVAQGDGKLLGWLAATFDGQIESAIYE